MRHLKAVFSRGKLDSQLLPLLLDRAYIHALLLLLLLLLFVRVIRWLLGPARAKRMHLTTYQIFEDMVDIHFQVYLALTLTLTESKPDQPMHNLFEKKVWKPILNYI